MTRLELFVPGVPKTKGSFRLLKNKKTGKMFPANSPDVDDWEGKVCSFTMKAWGDAPLLTGPIRTDLEFLFSRPASHYGTGRNAGILKANAPMWVAGKTLDADKLERAIWDSLTKVVWDDDGRVADSRKRKRYVQQGEKPGVRIIVEEL